MQFSLQLMNKRANEVMCKMCLLCVYVCIMLCCCTYFCLRDSVIFSVAGAAHKRNRRRKIKSYVIFIKNLSLDCKYKVDVFVCFSIYFFLSFFFFLFNAAAVDSMAIYLLSLVQDVGKSEWKWMKWLCVCVCV